jgi:glycosyltransferase involved in cell wall biosynthesis
MAKITIGMPLYNNAETLSKAIDSVLAQSAGDFLLLLSDDGSSDSTWDICQYYVSKDSRVKAIKQKSNLYYLNFLYLLEHSSSEYFCWLAGDDYMHPLYIEKCLRELERNGELVGCGSKCEFFDPKSNRTSLAIGTFGITSDNTTQRILEYLAMPSDNTRMYGLYRRNILFDAFPRKIFHAYDWALSIQILNKGKYKELNEILLFREKTVPLAYNKMVSRDHSSVLFRFFPVLAMTIYLLSKKRIPKNHYMLKALFWLNMLKHESYIIQATPSLYEKLEVIYKFYNKHIKWRISPIRFLRQMGE